MSYRILRRAGLDPYYSQGFHPHPVMSFGPALGLGIPSLATRRGMLSEIVSDVLRSLRRTFPISSEPARVLLTTQRR